MKQRPGYLVRAIKKLALERGLTSMDTKYRKESTIEVRVVRETPDTCIFCVLWGPRDEGNDRAFLSSPAYKHLQLVNTYKDEFYFY